MKRPQKRRCKCKHHHLGKIGQVPSDNATNEDENREEGGHGSRDRCQDRGQDLAAPLKGGLHERFSFLYVTENIFEDYNGIIHNYPKDKDQPKESQPIDRKAKRPSSG